MNYITFNEYAKMGGTLDDTTFSKYVYDAEMTIKTATFNRITTPSEAVKRCMVKLIDIISKSDITTSEATTFSHDGLSASVSLPSSEDYKKEIRNTIHTYLSNEVSDDGIPLLYCGVRYA